MTQVTLTVTDKDFVALSDAALAAQRAGQVESAHLLDDLARAVNSALSGGRAVQSPLEFFKLRELPAS